jgi:large conductance mechanosensitive channel
MNFEHLTGERMKVLGYDKGRASKPEPLAQTAGAVVISYGLRVNVIINFLIIAAVVFFFIVRPIARMNARQAAKVASVPATPTTKDCPFCCTSIPIKATRCPNCTSPLTK